jgi:N-acetylglucosamine-6-sulfatase
VEGPRDLPLFSRARLLISGLVLGGALAVVLVIRPWGGGSDGSGVSPSASAAPGSPNIVLILTDDQRWDSMWAMPKTRHLLGDHGVRFTNSFVVNALCCPSRASILTGRYSHGTGVYTNFPPLGGFSAFDPTSTIATVLQARGYRTALMGKYLNGYTRTEVPPGWDTWNAFNNPTRGVTYFDYPMSQNGKEVHYGSAPADYSTDVLAGLARTFITETHQPFFLYFATSAPHMPAAAAPRDAHVFPDLPPLRPPSFDEADTSDKPPWLSAIPPFEAGRIAREDDIRVAQDRSLPPVDDAVQSIVDTLRATGQLHNTLILYMSDNGYMYGEHRLGGKQVPYEESIRVPMILRYDPLTSRPTRDPRMVLNIDLAATFADAAGTQMPNADGSSLLDLIRHPSMPGRRWFLIEHVRQFAPSADNEGSPIPTYCAVRSRRWKYVYYADGSRELYDLAHDPYELQNLIDVPSAHDALTVADAELHELCVPPPPGLTLP